MHRLIAPFVGFACTLVLACGGSKGANDADMQRGRDQAATGALLFERTCQSCHGEHGEGGPDGPAVLGKKQLGKKFHNAQQLFDYVIAKMPKDDPGSLDVGQGWNIVTFMVAASGKKLDDRLSESNAEDTRLDK